MKKWSIKITLLLVLFSPFSEASEPKPALPTVPAQAPQLTEQYCQKLHEAVMNNCYFEVANMLSSVKADCRDQEGNTATHYFARYAKGENAHRILMLLTYRGFATLNLKNKAGLSPMMVALEYGNQASLYALIAFSSWRNPLTEDVNIPQ